MDIPRRTPEDDAHIKARQDVAGRFGFILGCIAAAVALVIDMMRAPRPLTFISLALAVLMAALNLPLGIILGLLGERATRRRPKKRR
jgi:hypothetical protein